MPDESASETHFQFTTIEFDEPHPGDTIVGGLWELATMRQVASYRAEGYALFLARNPETGATCIWRRGKTAPAPAAATDAATFAWTQYASRVAILLEATRLHYRGLEKFLEAVLADAANVDELRLVVDRTVAVMLQHVAALGPPPTDDVDAGVLKEAMDLARAWYTSRTQPRPARAKAYLLCAAFAARRALLEVAARAWREASRTGDRTISFPPGPHGACPR